MSSRPSDARVMAFMPPAQNSLPLFYNEQKPGFGGISNIYLGGFPKPEFNDFENPEKGYRNRTTLELDKLIVYHRSSNYVVIAFGSDIIGVYIHPKGNDIIFVSLDIPSQSENHKTQIEFLTSYLIRLFQREKDFQFDPNHRLERLSQDVFRENDIFTSAMFGWLFNSGKQRVLSLTGAGNNNSRLYFPNERSSLLLPVHTFEGRETLLSLVRSDSGHVSMKSTTGAQLGDYARFGTIRILFGSDGIMGFSEKPQPEWTSLELMNKALTWGLNERGDDASLGIIELRF